MYVADVRTGVDDGRARPKLPLEPAAVLGLVRAGRDVGEEAPVSEVPAERQPTGLGLERRASEAEEDRVDTVATRPHDPPETGSAGPARTGAKRRESPAAHGRQHCTPLM